MPLKLTWDDLLEQNITPEEGSRWLGDWSFLVHGTVAPLYLSKFGDWFLRRPDGSTEELSVIEGTLTIIARTPEQFAKLINSQEWQEEHLLSLVVYQLHERGVIAGKRQCYGFAPHPALSGEVDLNAVMIMGIGAWQRICAGLFAPPQGGSAAPTAPGSAA